MREIANIYNSLFRFESMTKVVNYPIHKKLKFGHDDGLLDWINKKVEFLKDEHVLDAGCGTGHALFYLCKNNDISGTGISISENEVDFASREAKRLNLSNRIHFFLMNYNEKLPGLYDKVLALESLKHSQNLVETLNNLLGSLTEGGTMVIADDFLNSDSVNAKKHMDLWQAHSFTTLDRLMDIILNFGDFDVDAHDMTKLVPTKSSTMLQFANKIVDAVFVFTFNRMKRNLKTYKGALLLEGLYNKKRAKYLVLIIKKKK